MLRFLTAGESHGPSLSVIVEGLPAGLDIGVEEIADELARRRLGYGRGPRMRFERDELRLIGGVRHGRTLGSPVAVEILNSEWPKWEQEMSAAPGTPAQKQTKPRPGHADLAGMQKYNFDDARDVLERASARETAARVVAGALAKALLSTIGVAIVSHVIRIGEAATPSDVRPLRVTSTRSTKMRFAASIPRVPQHGPRDQGRREGRRLTRRHRRSHRLRSAGGLGSHVHWDRKLDGLLAGALMSIQAVKAVEIGDGFSQASQRGSVAHDAIAVDDSFDQGGGYIRRTDHAGGTEGGSLPARRSSPR